MQRYALCTNAAFSVKEKSCCITRGVFPMISVTISMKKQLVENLSGPMEVQGQEAGIWLPVSRLQQLVAALPRTGECDFQRISPVVSTQDRSLIDLLQGN
jgi:hypothetical protein